MTVLISAGTLRLRGSPVSEELAPLAASLRGDLLSAFPTDDIWVPPEKAKLTRAGGRCRADGTLLAFDPRQPRRHRCPLCGAEYSEESDYRWWIMNYQLWLADRAVHAAALAATLQDERCRTLARSILEAYSERYLTYPNNDNVLGPTRLFFSTYLESIWLLQIGVALDLLEGFEGASALSAAVRERILSPSLEVIRAYDEGQSNRQVWNNAALAAAGRLLERTEIVEESLLGRSGLVTHLTTSLLADGTWYEGENYHLFAHRGLWYGVRIAEEAGVALSDVLIRRFDAGFSTPFLTALPDLTFPSRRDSQYRVSLRQWRIAESCELGLARCPDDERLRAALVALYRSDAAPVGDTGRALATAEAERNMDGVRLTRASLGWKGLLFALPELPPLAGAIPASALLPDQGYAVIRREQGRGYVALDYGHSGNGHGHPDRLNIWLVHGDERVLEDPGTGSYTSPLLHWYRSSLAHNAPFVNGRSQRRADGALLAYGDADDVGFVVAECAIAPDVVVTRAVFVIDDCMIDEVSWIATAGVRFELPVHAAGHLEGASQWRSGDLAGGDEPEDGFPFASNAMRADALASVLHLRTTGSARAWFDGEGVEWWRADAPGPPGMPNRPFYLIRSFGASGRLRSAWTWSADIRAVEFQPSRVSVTKTSRSFTILNREDGWLIERNDDIGRQPITVAVSIPFATSLRRASSMPVSKQSPAPTVLRARGTLGGCRYVLGPASYRRSELEWKDAGAPAAEVSIHADARDLVLTAAVRKADVWFAPPIPENPLDNEHPDINSDGLQLYLHGRDLTASWILVPVASSSVVRTTPRLGQAATIPLVTSWSRTPEGWGIRIAIPRDALPDRGREPFSVDLLINEMPAPPARERRRGQLVLSGGDDGWIYLRGDRQDADRALPFVIADD